MYTFLSDFKRALRKLLPTYTAAFSRTIEGSRIVPRLRAKEAGFTLLLAALIASIVLSLGASIYTIALKQVQLSSLGRDSQFAFYAADTGAECALYWDVRYDAFATSTAITPTCDGKSVSVTRAGTAYPYSYTFETDLFTDQSTGYCAQVTVIKNAAAPHTVIHVDGYSVTCSAKTASNRALQRSVELRY